MAPTLSDVLLVGACAVGAIALVSVIIDAHRSTTISRRLNDQWRAKAAADARQQALIDQQLAKPIPYEADTDPEGGLDLTKIQVTHNPGTTELESFFLDGEGYGRITTYNAKGELVTETISKTGVRIGEV